MPESKLVVLTKNKRGEQPVRLCNFVDVYYNWAITKEKAKSFMVASAKQTERNALPQLIYLKFSSYLQKNDCEAISIT